MKPEEIEKKSFEIIDEEAGPHDFDPRQWQVVRRIIHTTADFEYMKTIRFHPRAIENGIRAIAGGKPVFTDTVMALSGIRKADLARFGGEAQCLIGEEDIFRLAKEKGITRAKAAVDAALPRMKGGIYVVGNAPTALLRLIEHLRDKKAEPSLVVGFPVGFVNAAESKEELAKLDFPCITNVGRKGGSNVAAATVNALIKMALEKQE